jgi:hypothetical protein
MAVPDDTPRSPRCGRRSAPATWRGDGYEDIIDIVGTEDELLRAEQRTAGVPVPASFAEQYKEFAEQNWGETDVD